MATFAMLALLQFAITVYGIGTGSIAHSDCKEGAVGATEMKELTVIWMMDPFDDKKAVEGDWIESVILRDIPHRRVVDSSHSLFVDNALIVFSSSTPGTLTPLRTYFEEYRARGLKFSVYHLSDEFYQADPQRTLYDSVSGVAFRNYFMDIYALQPKVEFLPLGFTNGAFRLTNDLKKPSERGYSWAFIGQISRKPSREAMRNAMLEVGNVKYYTHETNTWGRFDPVSMNATQMGTVLADSIFCPSPRGWWNKDSFRWTEALEFGCIPIVEDDPPVEPINDEQSAGAHNQPHYFRHMLGEAPPFPTVRDWSEASELVRDLLGHPRALQALWEQCMGWYAGYKVRIAQRVALLLK